MLITFLVFTGIILSFLIGLAAGDYYSKQYNPRLYTLVIEHYQPDFQESTYDVRKFISDEERQAFIDSHTIKLIESGLHQDGRTLTDDQNSIYIVLHEID